MGYILLGLDTDYSMWFDWWSYLWGIFSRAWTQIIGYNWLVELFMRYIFLVLGTNYSMCFDWWSYLWGIFSWSSAQIIVCVLIGGVIYEVYSPGLRHKLWYVFWLVELFISYILQGLDTNYSMCFDWWSYLWGIFSWSSAQIIVCVLIGWVIY